MVTQAACTDARLTMTGPHTDDEVIVRCLDGARDDFRLLVERYGDAVFGTVYLMTHDRSLAEELTQETFVKAWRGLPGFRTGEPFRPWLMRIAVNQVVSHKRRRFLAIVPLPESDYGLPRSEHSPEATAILADDGGRLRQAIAELPGDQRRAVVLRYYADLSIPEIAAATGWPEGTVKSRLHRALERMKTVLESNDE
jgi:RNA polymerase sigma-70 factor (ECF subfamily)